MCIPPGKILGTPLPVGYRRYLPTGLNGTLFLKVELRHLQAVIDFMYRGQVQVCPQDLASFLDLAEELQVKGLTRRTSEQQPPNAAATKDELLQTPAKSSKTDLEAKEGLLLASNNIGLVVKGVRSLNPEAFGPELEKEAARDSSAASIYDEVTPIRTSRDSTAAAAVDATESRSDSRPPDKDEVKISMIVTHHSKRKTLSSSYPKITGNESDDSSSSTRKRSRQDSSTTTGSSSSSSSKSTSEPAASQLKSTTQSRVLPVGSQGVSTETPNPGVKKIDNAGVVDLPREAAAKKEIDITDHMEAVRKSLLVVTSPGSIPSTTGQRGSTSSRVDVEGGGKESTAVLLAELDQKLEKLSQDFVVAKAGGSWQCLSCEQLFAEKADCQHHIERRHVAVPSGHLCKLCGRRFGSVRAAKEHVEAEHGSKEDKKISKDSGPVEIITI
jgi:hypothetical protein